MAEVIAVCGVDGCGKSSLIRAYGERSGRDDLIIVHKTTNANVQLTQGYHHRVEAAEQRRADWLSGSFALSIGAGAMFDFLSHYKQHIEPHLNTSGSGGAATLLCDRYTPCFLAYLYGTGNERLFDQLFARVKPPTQVIHVDVAFEHLQQRYDARLEKNEDEFIELMMAFREGYDKVYERLGIEPVIITNNADFDSAYTEFSALIDSWRL